MNEIEKKVINLVKDRQEKTSINLTKKEEESVSSIIKEYDYKVGDMFLDIEDFRLYRIKKISDNKDSKVYGDDCFKIEYTYYKNMISPDYSDLEKENSRWRSYGNLSAGEFKRKMNIDYSHGWVKVKSIKEIDQCIKDFEKNINDLSTFDLNENSEQSSETALTIMDQNLLQNMSKIYEEKKAKIAILQAVAKYKMQQLQAIKEKFNNVVQKIHQVIYKIELYLGVSEEVVQIQDGEAANVNTPIHLLQRVLYMDEEVGVVEDGGLDWKHIDDFDNWLVEGHLDLIAPFSKCVVILRVRRNDKRYSDKVWENSELNEENHYTYILIRNGDKVYRIYADLIIEPRLFPKKTELSKMLEDRYDSDRDKFIDKYHKHFLVIQGILDRSTLLHPLPHKIDIFKEETWKDTLKLVYDDDMLLPDGRLLYKDWREKLNSYNKVGSRIVFTGNRYDDDLESRVSSKWAPCPGHGIYNIKRQINSNYSGERFVFYFNPKDTVYSWSYRGYDSHDRKKAVSFEFRKNDSFILNYDNIKIEDLDFYINCRQEREYYLSLIPLLKQIKQEKLKELEEEEVMFKKLIISQLHIEDTVKVNRLLDKTIDWWKFKVKEKRPLIREDAKALRMIKSKFVKELKVLK